MRQIAVVVGFLSLFFCLTAFKNNSFKNSSGSNGNSITNGKKVLICHVPPGNPANRHTIIVSENAVAAHLAHGDYLGECVPTPAALTSSVSKTDISCNGSCNGSAMVAASGGKAPYTYKWSTGATASSITRLCAGTYKVTVTDSKRSSVTAQVTITSSLQLSLSSVSETCAGSCNGSASALASGGTAPYYYIWGIEGGESATISGFCAGVYSITVTDAAGCQVEGTQVIRSGACKMSGDEIETSFSGKPASIKAYPNPFRESATLEFSVNEVQNVKAEVVSVDGRRMLTLHDGIADNNKNYSFKISGNDFVPGMYFFNVTGEDGKMRVAKLFMTK